MEFEYKPVKMFDATIDIENIAQCALELTDSLSFNYYLIITTILGESIVFEYGPIVPDIKMLPKSVVCSITKVNYDLYRLKKIISTFIADRKNSKTQLVRELPMREALDLCLNPLEYMEQYLKEESEFSWQKIHKL